MINLILELYMTKIIELVSKLLVINAKINLLRMIVSIKVKKTKMIKIKIKIIQQLISIHIKKIKAIYSIIAQ